MFRFQQYDVVRIVRFIKEPEPPASSDSFNQRKPRVGDIATIVELYTDPPGYELECCSNSDGITTWLRSFTLDSIELESVNSKDA